MPVTPHAKLVRAVWRDQMHIEPGALERSPWQAQARFEHAWAPAEIIMQHLQGYPAGWLQYWLWSGRGHLVFTHLPSRYAPGPQPWRDGVLDDVAYLNVADLATAPDGALICLLHLFDHLLGSRARAGGAWFSEGAGTCPALQEAAQRFAQCHSLGYGHGALGTASAPDYFARSVLLYLQDSQLLNTLDPLVERLYALTLWQENFWQRVLRELDQASGEAIRS
jgi:hypothetical protein